MKQAMADLAKKKSETEKRVREFSELTRRFKSLIDAGKLSVKIVEGRMVVALGTDILFGSGSARLSEAGESAIEEVTKTLAGIEGRKFQIEGHTDNVPIQTAQFPSNWELASARALNVLKWMVKSGMPGNRISAAAFADTQPIASNDTKEGKAANRRIEIVVVPDLSQLPGYDELSKMSEESPQ
jgi:chemotaxis protein MotB